MKKKSISIFGVTGSVGSSTIELLRHRREEFEVIALTCNKNIDLLLELSREFKPKFIAVSDENFFLDLKRQAGNDFKCFAGKEGLKDIANLYLSLIHI